MKNWNDYKKTFGVPSLFDFARTGDLQGLAELIKANPQIDLNQKNHKGYSALMLSVYNNQQIFSEALLRAGADPNSKDNVGNSILMGAAFKGNIELINLLLSFGADPMMKNNTGMTALDWARTFGRQEVISFFQGKYQMKGRSKLDNYFRFLILGCKLVYTKKRER
jgi:ankyrin repeat protein